MWYTGRREGGGGGGEGGGRGGRREGSERGRERKRSDTHAKALNAHWSRECSIYSKITITHSCFWHDTPTHTNLALLLYTAALMFPLTIHAASTVRIAVGGVIDSPLAQVPGILLAHVIVIVAVQHSVGVRRARPNAEHVVRESGTVSVHVVQPGALWRGRGRLVDMVDACGHCTWWHV